MYYPCSKNKGADQLGSYSEADQRLCFRICNFFFHDAAQLLECIHIHIRISCPCVAGLLGVIGSFIYGLRGVAKGDNKANLRGQTGRVVFQSIVILGIVGDFYWESRKLREARERRKQAMEAQQNQ